MPSVSVLDKYGNQIRAVFDNVDQQLEASLTEVNRLPSHHLDNNPAPSSLLLTLQRSFKALPISSSRNWEMLRRIISSPMKSHQFFLSTSSSNLLHTFYKKGYRNLALSPPELLNKTNKQSCARSSLAATVDNIVGTVENEGTQSSHKVERWP